MKLEIYEAFDRYCTKLVFDVSLLLSCQVKEEIILAKIVPDAEVFPCSSSSSSTRRVLSRRRIYIV